MKSPPLCFSWKIEDEYRWRFWQSNPSKQPWSSSDANLPRPISASFLIRTSGNITVKLARLNLPTSSEDIIVSTYSSPQSGPTSPQLVKSMQPRQEDNTRKISKGITAAVNISFTLDRNDDDDEGSYWKSQWLKKCYTLTILRLSTEPLWGNLKVGNISAMFESFSSSVSSSTT